MAFQAHFSVSAHSETLHKQVCYDLSPKKLFVFITAAMLHNPVQRSVQFTLDELSMDQQCGCHSVKHILAPGARQHKIYK